jgi:hypothetical protein
VKFVSLKKKHIQTRTEEMYNRHTAIDVSLSSPHGTGATGRGHLFLLESKFWYKSAIK